MPREARQGKTAAHTAWLSQLFDQACDPRFKSRRGRQSAHYTRSAFTLRGGVLRLAKTAAPLRFTWSWPDMVRDSRLARVISDCGWGELRRLLACKCQRYGRELVVIDRWYPSSKTCSTCGHLLPGLSLSTRHWTCPSCRARHDRDINAAKNILAAGRAVARNSPGDACRADVRHSGSSRVQSAVKQEPRLVTAGIPVLQGEE